MGACMNTGHNGGPPIREGNWIAVSREMIEHHIVGAGNMVTPADKNRGSFSRLESWLDLLSMANFAERKITVQGATLVLKPGQTLAGRAFLAKRWNWTEKAVRVWLDKLSTELMITLACEKLKEGQTKGHGPNVLSVCNWAKYQIEPQAEGPGLGWPEGQPRASQGPHYNKETNKQYNPNNARDADRAGQDRGKSYWADAMSVPGAYNPNEGVFRDPATGVLQLINGVRATWLERFGGDEVALDLALIQAAPYVKPNGAHPIRTQVEAQLAKQLGWKAEKAKADKLKRTPTGSDWAEIAKKAREQEGRK